MARPQQKINWELFEDLCEIQCTQREIANILKIHTDTLRDRAVEHYNMGAFSAVYDRFADPGRMSLRRAQFKLAQTNATMAIWLGKQYLGQRDTTQDIAFSAEALKAFSETMRMIAQAQADQVLKMEEINTIKSLKSA